MEKTQALSGIRAIELGNFVSAPYCGKLLADCGAEVIKIEEPGKGDESRSYGPFLNDVVDPEKSGLFLYLNTSKLSVTLDVKTSKGQRILKDLLSQADIFIENNSPRQMEEWGLTYESLASLKRGLIVTSITPFGQTGPYREYKAYHHNACALGGAFALGDPDKEPLTYPVLQGHFQGGVHAAMATMLALFARRATGEGQHVDIAEADIWAAYHGAIGVQAYVFAGRVRKRAGYRTKGYYYPLCILPCKDGYISETAVLGSQWKSFLELIGGGQVPDWYRNDPRFKDRVKSSIEYADELDKRQLHWLMEHTKEEIFSLCQKRRIPFCPVYSIDEVVDHPHLKEYKYFIELAHPKAGTLKYPGAPFKFSGSPMNIKRAPCLGEHNEEIYGRRLGYSQTDLVDMRQSGVI